MKLSRRAALKWAALAGGAASLAGCERIARSVSRAPLPDRIALPEGPVDPLVRLIDRTGFGPTPGQVARVKLMGAAMYIEEQLRGDLPEEPHLEFALNRLDVNRVHSAELEDVPEELALEQLQRAALLRAVYSRNQLKERLADFWTNHFNIYARKARGVYSKPDDERRVVRDHALGWFSDMLRESATSPAMIEYLDNQQNRSGVPNENYARELLELHTLGVDGGYTYQDIKELARCLTGWTVETRFLRPRGRIRFDPDLHDDGPKRLLGQSIPAGGGERDLDRVLHILSRHPSTAKFICRKLCRLFLGDDAPRAYDVAVTAFTASNGPKRAGDIRSAVRAILASGLDESRPILKRPFDWVASALRALRADTDCDRSILEHIDSMGQPLYEWPMPDGYPDDTVSWTGSMLPRWSFALALGSNELPRTQLDLEALAAAHGGNSASAIAATVLSRRADDEPVKAIVRAASDPENLGLVAALALASPEFQWR
ncbi:MAG: DUF1800 domain-containing protein [Armatimonadetes bacterium]|nr:DUF1800 domain-containing protein [Armatimonadota bacterium]NOG39044.1 DUF1800 domain-containing protein [Armatimonadota bacterium]GIK33008.1 MAG: hypothetical protein BroJett009_20000 [Armatimonadota bacterium]